MRILRKELGRDQFPFLVSSTHAQWFLGLARCCLSLQGLWNLTMTPFNSIKGSPTQLSPQRGSGSQVNFTQWLHAEQVSV
jgi:hypothetical protein